MTSASLSQALIPCEFELSNDQLSDCEGKSIHLRMSNWRHCSACLSKMVEGP